MASVLLQTMYMTLAGLITFMAKLVGIGQLPNYTTDPRFYSILHLGLVLWLVLFILNVQSWIRATKPKSMFPLLAMIPGVMTAFVVLLFSLVWANSLKWLWCTLAYGLVAGTFALIELKTPTRRTRLITASVQGVFFLSVVVASTPRSSFPTGGTNEAKTKWIESNYGEPFTNVTKQLRALPQLNALVGEFTLKFEDNTILRLNSDGLLSGYVKLEGKRRHIDCTISRGYKSITSTYVNKVSCQSRYVYAQLYPISAKHQHKTLQHILFAQDVNTEDVQLMLPKYTALAKAQTRAAANVLKPLLGEAPYTSTLADRSPFFLLDDQDFEVKTLAHSFSQEFPKSIARATLTLHVKGSKGQTTCNVHMVAKPPAMTREVVTLKCIEGEHVVIRNVDHKVLLRTVDASSKTQRVPKDWPVAQARKKLLDALHDVEAHAKYKLTDASLYFGIETIDTITSKKTRSTFTLKHHLGDENATFFFSSKAPQHALCRVTIPIKPTIKLKAFDHTVCWFPSHRLTFDHKGNLLKRDTADASLRKKIASALPKTK